MAPRHRNVIHPYFTVVTSSHFELRIVFSEIEQVDCATRVFFKRQGLHYDVAIAFWLLYVDEFIDFIGNLE